MGTKKSSARRVKSVSIYEVGPRDGLQNEPVRISTPDKIRFITALMDAGLKRIEATSFVSPKWIPQLADAEELMLKIERRKGVVFSALVPNLAGLERAKRVGIDEACVFLSVTESHSKKNINKSVAEAVKAARETAEAARKAGMQVRVYLSCVWGCPYEGVVTPKQVLAVAKQVQSIDMSQLALGDTIGVGNPTQTVEILDAIFEYFPKEKIGLHLHDTRGTALANALAGIQAGVTSLDSSLGGLGGCPYAPGAAGNLATEDLAYMLEGMGISTGVDLSALVAAGELMQSIVGKKLPGKYLQATLGTREKKKAAQVRAQS